MENQIYYSRTLEDFQAKDLDRYPSTLDAFLEFCVDKYRDKPFVGKAFETPLTYGEFLEKVDRIAGMLVNRGIIKGDRIALLGENSPHWGITYFAIIRSGAIAVPILPDFPESDILHIISDSEAKILFTTHRQLEKLSDLDSVKVKSIIMLDDLDEDANNEIKRESLTDIFDKAIDFIRKIPETMGLTSRELTADDTASIIYTSGTSGHSKAVMLSHRAFISNTVAMSVLSDFGPEDVFLSILPLPHTYEFTVGFMLAIISGARIVYMDKAPTPRNLENVCKEERPTAICAVPLILEKIFKKKVQPVLEKSLAVKILTKVPGLKKKIYKKINSKLMEFFGGRLKVMAIGGAPFNPTAEKFFRTAGFPYLIGYGLTETAPLLAGGPLGDKGIRITSTGKPCPGCQIKIVDADKKTGIGEIYGKGPNVMKGYFGNPELTAEVLDEDGWFKTGDQGYFDKHNNLYIRGRSKNMILMSNGENIYPEVIEAKLNAYLHVAESLVLEANDKLEAWVYLDYERIDEETRGQTEPQRLAHIKKVLEEIKVSMNAQLSAFSKLSRVLEQTEPFVKTATHKIKRYLYTHPEEKK